MKCSYCSDNFIIVVMCTYFILRSIMTDRRSYLTYEERRCRFLCLASVYFISWMVVGFVFLTVFLKQQQGQSLFLMIFFLVYGVIELIVTIVLYNKTSFPWSNDFIVVGAGPRYPMVGPGAQPYGYPPQNTYNIYNNYQSSQAGSTPVPPGNYNYPQPYPNYQGANQAGRYNGI